MEVTTEIGNVLLEGIDFFHHEGRGQVGCLWGGATTGCERESVRLTELESSLEASLEACRELLSLFPFLAVLEE